MGKVEIEELMQDIDKNSDYIEELVNNLVNKCCDKLDLYIDYVNKLMSDGSYEVSNKELDDIIMTIPTMLYYVGSQQEKLGIKRDVAKSVRSQMYNQIYMELTGTATDKKVQAESRLFDETMVTTIYSTAFDIIKSKVDSAFEILQSAKKVVSRRMSESELSKVTPNRDKFG